MTGILQPLAKEFAIVGEDGKPTDYFIRWAQQRQIDIGNGISLADLEAYLAAHPLQAGLGISITPDGNISNDPTIALDAGLDDLNDVDLTTPPTDGQALVYDSGTSMWVPGDVSGGLAVEDEGTPVVTTATTLNFTGSGVTVTDAGGGQADIAISAGSPAALTYWVVHDTGTGASQNVTLPYTVTTEEEVDVYVNGVHYETDEYTVSGTTLTLTTNASGDSIEVRGEIISGGGGGGAYTLIETITLGSAAASIDFTSIPSTYKDLIATWTLRGSTAVGNADMYVRCNNDSGANYDYEFVHWYATGSAVNQSTGQTRARIGNISSASATANHASRGQLTIPNYAETTFYKQGFSDWYSSLGTGGFTQGRGLYGFNWRNTSAIDRLTFLPNADNFIAGSTISLYGRG